MLQESSLQSTLSMFFVLTYTRLCNFSAVGLLHNGYIILNHPFSQAIGKQFRGRIHLIEILTNWSLVANTTREVANFLLLVATSSTHVYDAMMKRLITYWIGRCFIFLYQTSATFVTPWSVFKFLKYLCRKQITKMMCMKCMIIQPVGASCSNISCSSSMGKYYCKICKLFDDDR